MQMKRERATTVLNEMLERLEQNAWPLNLITEIHIFGSYIRGAWRSVISTSWSSTPLTKTLRPSNPSMPSSAAVDGYVPMRQALRGNRRGISFQFQGRDSLQSEDIELLLLWRQGEPIALAKQRLAAITPDTTAGRAPRDHVLPA
ncbi:hypothetical protein WKI65_38360 [Streptomyces sp. MS1.AVA.3]|uniref:hypothetical protein n=1 Tax=Streptomyces decoyicus TaxID=249567 RepID=UPI0030BEED9B